MNFIEMGGNADSGDDAHYCSEKHKNARMRETRIRTFMQKELEACLDEIDWMMVSQLRGLRMPTGGIFADTATYPSELY